MDQASLCNKPAPHLRLGYNFERRGPIARRRSLPSAKQALTHPALARGRGARLLADPGEFNRHAAEPDQPASGRHAPSPEALTRRVGETAWGELLEDCRAVARAYPACSMLGIDAAVVADNRRLVVFEVNAFGDHIKGVRFRRLHAARMADPAIPDEGGDEAVRAVRAHGIGDALDALHHARHQR